MTTDANTAAPTNDYPTRGSAANPYPAAHGTNIRVGRIRASIGTAMGYAAEYGDDPVAAVIRCLKRHYETVWASAAATVISDPPTRDVIRLQLNVGDHIRVEGRTFKVCAPHMAAGDGDNPRLVDVTPAEVAAKLSPAVTVAAERGPRKQQVTGRWPSNP